MTADDRLRHVIGVDAGGSGVRARLRGATDTLRSRQPGNLLLGAPAAAAIADAARAVARAAGVDPSEATVVVAAAGDTPRGRRTLADAAQSFAGLRVLSDVCAAALGAHGGEDGAVIVLGTGAAGCVLRDGCPHYFGGWGLAIDDLGSGAHIGRLALRTALRVHDGDVSPGSLTLAISRRFGAAPSALVDWARGAAPGDLASLAPLVFAAAETGDPDAETILAEAVAALRRLADIARGRGAVRIAAAGSVGVRLAARADAPAGLTSPALDAIDGAFLALDRGLAEALPTEGPGVGSPARHAATTPA